MIETLTTVLCKNIKKEVSYLRINDMIKIYLLIIIQKKNIFLLSTSIQILLMVNSMIFGVL